MSVKMDETKVMRSVSDPAEGPDPASLPPRTTTVSPGASGSHAAPPMPHPGPQFLGGTEAPSFQEFAERFIQAVAPMAEAKAAQYGSNSLAAKGHRYARAQGRAAKDQEALELGVFQYMAEKMDRIEDAALRSEPASQDTLIDVTVYGLMLLYIRKHGSWL
jgi:hypothetical protein